MSAFPRLDLNEFRHGSTAERARFAASLGAALHEVGYLVLDHPGVPPELLDAGMVQARALFEASPRDKQASVVEASRGMIGYSAGDPNEAYGAGEAVTELWHVGEEFGAEAPPAGYFANVWPDGLPLFKDTVLRVRAKMAQCALDLVRAYSLWLTGDAERLVPLFTPGFSLFRLMHYPPWGADRDVGAMRASPHVDAAMLTLYSGGSAAGLEFQSATGEWIAIDPAADDVLVGAGEIFELMTLGLVKPTLHRVVYPDGAPAARYSLPYFLLPGPRVPLDALAAEARARGGTREPQSITVGQLIARRAGWGDDAAYEERSHRKPA